jgi:hypothetical protein
MGQNRRIQPHFVLYGYPAGEPDHEQPLRLREATIVADPPVLRRLAEFFTHAAELLEIHGTDFGHEHYGFFVGLSPAQMRTADIIVSRPYRLDEPPN